MSARVLDVADSLLMGRKVRVWSHCTAPAAGAPQSHHTADSHSHSRTVVQLECRIEWQPRDLLGRVPLSPATPGSGLESNDVSLNGVKLEVVDPEGPAPRLLTITAVHKQQCNITISVAG